MALTEGSRKIVAGWPIGGFPMECAETIKCGDLLAISSAGELVPVDSDDGEQARLIAGKSGEDGDFIPCYVGAIVEGFTGCTEAAAIYPSITAGQYTETADTTGSDTNTIIGYALTETMILAIPGMRADSTA